MPTFLLSILRAFFPPAWVHSLIRHGANHRLSTVFVAVARSAVILAHTVNLRLQKSAASCIFSVVWYFHSVVSYFRYLSPGPPRLPYAAEQSSAGTRWRLIPPVTWYARCHAPLTKQKAGQPERKVGCIRRPRRYSYVLLVVLGVHTKTTSCIAAFRT